MIEPNGSADPAVLVSDLTLGYPAHAGGVAHNAVEGVGFEVRRGEVRALLGESGSGKSTLVRFLAGQGATAGDRSARIRVHSGDANVLGVPMRRAGKRQLTRLTARVGYLGQTHSATLPPDLNVGDILMQPITERSRRFDRAQLGEQIAEMMDLVGLSLSKLQEYPYELSKGQRQRVAIIRSLMLAPSLYFADEPTLGVDALGRPGIIELFRWYRERSGATMVLVSHDIAMLEALVEQVLVMQQGRLVGAGDINEIFRQVDHSYVQQLARALRATAYDEIAE
ncbi:MAG: ATP-binding cassette domain-containing protein [Leucobacter sp.]